jgi:hypothetical protein
MKLQSLIDLRNNIWQSLDKHYPNENGAEPGILTEYGRVPPENRIALGYIQVKKGDFRLEIRVQRSDMSAHRLAQEIKEQARGEASIEVIPQIKVPPRTEISASNAKTPVLEVGKDRLHIGISIGHKEGGAGTLGAILNKSDGTYLLSCNHVIALMGKAEKGDDIFHPGNGDGKRLDADRRIAKLRNWVELSKTYPNTIDAAIARISNGWSYDSTRVPVGYQYPSEGTPIRSVKNIDDIVGIRDKKVCKIGRTTGYTEGVIRAVELERVPVLFPGIGNLIFNNVIELRGQKEDEPFSRPGDSGSLVYTADEHYAVGLVFAGGYRERDNVYVTYVCMLNPILEWAQAELLTED